MNDFPFKVGDKIRRVSWDVTQHITITAVGDSHILGIDNQDGGEYKYGIEGHPWERYPEPLFPILGSVITSGGGKISILVDRDTEAYPTTGQRVRIESDGT